MRDEYADAGAVHRIASVTCAKSEEKGRRKKFGPADGRGTRILFERRPDQSTAAKRGGASPHSALVARRALVGVSRSTYRRDVRREDADPSRRRLGLFEARALIGGEDDGRPVVAKE